MPFRDRPVEPYANPPQPLVRRQQRLAGLREQDLGHTDLGRARYETDDSYVLDYAGHRVYDRASGGSGHAWYEGWAMLGARDADDEHYEREAAARAGYPLGWRVHDANATLRRGRGPKGYHRADDRVREDVCERIIDARIDASDVDVQVKGGVVSLSGTVRNRIDKFRLEEIASDVSGVVDVENQIHLARREDPDRR